MHELKKTLLDLEGIFLETFEGDELNEFKAKFLSKFESATADLTRMVGDILVNRSSILPVIRKPPHPYVKAWIGDYELISENYLEMYLNESEESKQLAMTFSPTKFSISLIGAEKFDKGVKRPHYKVEIRVGDNEMALFALIEAAHLLHDDLNALNENVTSMSVNGQKDGVEIESMNPSNLPLTLSEEAKSINRIRALKNFSDSFISIDVILGSELSAEQLETSLRTLLLIYLSISHVVYQ